MVSEHAARTFRPWRTAFARFSREVASEAYQIGQATWVQTSRLCRYAIAAVARWRLRIALRDKKRMLGESAHSAGVGDEAVRQSISALDDQIHRNRETKKGVSGLRKERSIAIQALATNVLEKTPTSNPVIEAVRQTSAIRQAIDQHEIDMRQQRSELVPQSFIGWRRVAIGYFAIAITIMLGLLVISASRTSVSHRIRSKPTDAVPQLPVVGDSASKNTAPNTAQTADDSLAGPTKPVASASTAQADTPEGAQGEKPRSGTAEDLKKLVIAAGFDERSWYWSIESFVKYGSREAATRYLRGDQFERMDIKKAAESHREELRNKQFMLVFDTMNSQLLCLSHVMFLQ